MIFSIDQNSNSLWDTLPKLQALAKQSLATTHFVEDIDVAFTSLGSEVDDRALRIATEKFHPSGGSDWGAAAFYSDFLGRQPLELRTLEPQLGMKISALARQLGTTLDELYDELAVGDNRMLVGSSFVSDREHHRLIGDLSVAECRPYLQELMNIAELDCLQKFPATDSQLRTREWFSAERARLDRLIVHCENGSLVDLYKTWLGEYLGDSIKLDVTSNLFSLNGPPERFELLGLFLRDYETTAALYNQALAESNVGLHPLRIRQGELPFFAVSRHLGQLVRTEIFLRDNELVIAGRSFKRGPAGGLPIDALGQAGVICLVGKAVMMVLQVRTRPGQAGLALPYKGSLYMPAAARLEKLLQANKLLSVDAPPKPIFRVRFHLLDRMRDLKTTIALPGHLARAFGKSEFPACDLAQNYAALSNQARSRLEQFKEKSARETWLAQAYPHETQTIGELEAAKRELVKKNPKSPQARDIWKRIREISATLQKELLKKVVDDTQLAQVDFWDSRGALLPWCIALAGEKFYDDVLVNAVITKE